MSKKSIKTKTEVKAQSDSPMPSDYEAAAENAKAASSTANESGQPGDHRAAASMHRIAAEHAKMSEDFAHKHPDHIARAQTHDEAAEALEACMMHASDASCEHMNKDGSFKGGFEGCVAHMQSCDGHSEESAKKICGKIAQQVAGKDFNIRLNELSGRRMGKDKALLASVKNNGFTLNDLQEEICSKLQDLPQFKPKEGQLSCCPWCSNIIAPAHEAGEVWKAVSQGTDGKLYCIEFVVDDDHELRLQGEPKEVTPNQDYDYVNGELAEARREVAKAVLEAGDFIGHPFRGNQYGSGSGSEEHHEASRSANEASTKTKSENTKSNHTKAEHAHERAARLQEAAGNDEAADYHRSMASYHHSRAARFVKNARQAAPERELQARNEVSCAKADSRSLIAAELLDDGYCPYMPAGVHIITPSLSAAGARKPVTVCVEINEDTVEALEAQRKALTAGGKKPFFSIEHESEKAGFWPTEFVWEKRLVPSGELWEGVWARGEWTKSGRDAVEGKDYRTFSPTFFVSAIRNDPQHPVQVVCEDEARANMGALENDPAFQEMAALWASGKYRGIEEVQHAIWSSAGLEAGDFPGHPFRGNQYAEGQGEEEHNKASHEANEASRNADSKGGHRAAAAAHRKAAKLQEEEGHDDVAAYHRSMAAYHDKARTKMSAAYGGRVNWEQSQWVREAHDNLRARGNPTLSDVSHEVWARHSVKLLERDIAEVLASPASRTNGGPA